MSVGTGPWSRVNSHRVAGRDCHRRPPSRAMVPKTVLGAGRRARGGVAHAGGRLPVAGVSGSRQRRRPPFRPIEGHESLSRRTAGLQPGRHPRQQGGPRSDGLTNQQESIVGTHPRKADTDGNGKRDDRENADGDALWNRTSPRPTRARCARTPTGTVPRDGEGNPDDDRLADRRRRMARGTAQGRHGRQRLSRWGRGDRRHRPARPDPAPRFPRMAPRQPRRPRRHQGPTPNARQPRTAVATPVPTPTSAPTPTTAPRRPLAPARAPTVRGAPGCPIFPASNVWNQRIDGRSVAANSATMVDAIGLDRGPAHGLRLVRRDTASVARSSVPARRGRRSPSNTTKTPTMSAYPVQLRRSSRVVR